MTENRTCAQMTPLKRLQSFFVSKAFLLACLLFGCVTTVTGIEYYAIIALVCLMTVIFAVCDELIATLMPFMTLCCVAIKCFDSFNTYIRIVWIGVIAAAVLVSFFVRRWRKPRAGGLLWSEIAVTAAIMLGGVGKISAKEYFSLTSIYYMLGLGLAMIVVYVIASTYFTSNGRYDIKGIFAYVMYLICIFACAMILLHYIVNIKTVIRTGSIIEPQWRNNVSTFIMLTMPFAFYLSIERPHCIAAGLLTMPCLLLTSSRSALLFGGVEFMLCCVYVLIVDKKARRRNGIIIATMILIGALLSGQIYDFIFKTLSRFEHIEDEPRAGLIKRAVEDFRSNPLFGRGIGYMGNRDIHPSKKFAACWYHSSPFQIIGSFGLVGVAAFGFQFVMRCKTFVRRVNPFNVAIFIAYVGILMMSLVNPGEFSPLPYEMLVVIFFALIEQTTAKGKVKAK